MTTSPNTSHFIAVRQLTQPDSLHSIVGGASKTGEKSNVCSGNWPLQGTSRTPPRPNGCASPYSLRARGFLRRLLGGPLPLALSPFARLHFLMQVSQCPGRLAAIVAAQNRTSAH